MISQNLHPIFPQPSEKTPITPQGASVENIPESNQQKLSPADHVYSQIHLRHKLKLAHTLLQNYVGSNFIVFCGRKRDKFLLHKYLQKAGMSAELAPESTQNVEPIGTASIVISSDECQFQNYKNQVAGIIHFDIPMRFSSYIARINLLKADPGATKNISHSIVTLREVSMLEDFNHRLGVTAKSEVIPGFEEEQQFRPYEGFQG